MRWNIDENKKMIYTSNFNNHKDDIELSGEKVSAIITYQVSDNILNIKRQFIYPMFRIQPNNTLASYKPFDNDLCIDFKEKEVFDRVEIDGILTIYTHTKYFKIIHRFYPSLTLPIFYEQIEVLNLDINPVFLNWDSYKKVDQCLGCEGYIYTERISDLKPIEILPDKKICITFSYQARFANQVPLFENNSLNNRKKRVEELFSQCNLKTNNLILDTMFAFAKLRAGESIFNTKNGKIHSPGGYNYYAAIWCNDQSEYSTPWFAFTNDLNENEAAINAIKWYEKYMNEDYYPIPSSLISEGVDYWNGVGDRGDACMFLYGNTRYFLTVGRLPDLTMFNMLSWCAEYIIRHINDEGVITSDTDELENRISSGDVNLNTNALGYGAFKLFSILLMRMNLVLLSEKYRVLSLKLEESIIKYFSKEINGYKTFQYHQGCNNIRAWNCLPLYMGIRHNVDGTIESILDKLWFNGSCRSTEGEQILWDRSTLYFIATLFRCDYVDEAWERLLEYSQTRLLGERVPYAVEAYPEFNMRHLSAESALYCRIITDGILNIEFTVDGFTINPKISSGLNYLIIENIFCNNKYHTIEINNGVITVEVDGKILRGKLGSKLLIN